MRKGTDMTFRKLGEVLPPQSGECSVTASDPRQSQDSASNEFYDYCLARVALITGGRPKDEVENPEIYSMTVATVLAEYPRDIVDAVTDPRTGIQRRIKWLPMLNEITDACEELYAPIKRKAERDAR